MAKLRCRLLPTDPCSVRGITTGCSQLTPAVSEVWWAVAVLTNLRWKTAVLMTPSWQVAVLRNDEAVLSSACLDLGDPHSTTPPTLLALIKVGETCQSKQLVSNHYTSGEGRNSILLFNKQNTGWLSLPVFYLKINIWFIASFAKILPGMYLNSTSYNGAVSIWPLCFQSGY